jgi:hypothetical protein
MFRQLWKKWAIDKPAAFGDLLWEIFVVQFAALLNRLTPRRIIAIIPFVLVILAYAHQIPLPPELMLVGDALAYIDVLSVVLLLTVLSRVSTILFFARQAQTTSSNWRAGCWSAYSASVCAIAARAGRDAGNVCLVRASPTTIILRSQAWLGRRADNLKSSCDFSRPLVPAKAGTQFCQRISAPALIFLDSRFCRTFRISH